MPEWMSLLLIYLAFWVGGGVFLRRAVGARARRALRDAAVLLGAHAPCPEAIAWRFEERERARLLGIWLAWGVTNGLLLAGDVRGFRVDGPAWLVFGLAGGLAAGLAVLHAPAVAAPGPRIARIEARDLRDYVHPAQRVGVPLGAAALVAAATLGLVRFAAGERAGWVLLAPAVVGVAVLLAVVGRVGAGRVLRRPAPAARVEDLAWHEVLRAMALGDLVVVQALALNGAAAFLALGALGEGGPVRVAAAAILAVAVLAWVAAGWAETIDRCGWFGRHAGRAVGVVAR